MDWEQRGGHPPEPDFRARQFKQKLQTRGRNGTFFPGGFSSVTHRGRCVPPLNSTDKSCRLRVSGQWAVPGKRDALWHCGPWAGPASSPPAERQLVPLGRLSDPLGFSLLHCQPHRWWEQVRNWLLPANLKFLWFF